MARKPKGIENKLSNMSKINSDIADTKPDENLKEVLNKVDALQETLSDIEESLEEPKESESEPITNTFYESMKIPYCRVCGQRETIDSNGAIVCPKKRKNCKFK